MHLKPGTLKKGLVVSFLNIFGKERFKVIIFIKNNKVKVYIILLTPKFLVFVKKLPLETLIAKKIIKFSLGYVFTRL